MAKRGDDLPGSDARAPGAEGPDAFAARIRGDIALWRATADAAGIQPE